MSYVPRRVKVSGERLQGAPEWGRVLADTLGQGIEDVARAVEVLSTIHVLDVTVIGGGVSDTKPLTLSQAKGARALWIGGCQPLEQDEAPTPSIYWRQTTSGPRISAVQGLTEGRSYRLTLCWS